jgi:hypothetical protein
LLDSHHLALEGETGWDDILKRSDMLTRHSGSGVENLAFLAMTFATLVRRTEAHQEFANLQRRTAPDQPENSADRRLLREAQTHVEEIVR